MEKETTRKVSRFSYTQNPCLLIHYNGIRTTKSRNKIQHSKLCDTLTINLLSSFCLNIFPRNAIFHSCFPSVWVIHQFANVCTAIRVYGYFFVILLHFFFFRCVRNKRSRVDLVFYGLVVVLILCR